MDTMVPSDEVQFVMVDFLTKMILLVAAIIELMEAVKRCCGFSPQH